MLGAIIGDIVGSIHEFNGTKTKDFPFFGEGCDFTDDTVCTIAVAECLLDRSDPAASLRKWGLQYLHCGYGDLYLRWLESDNNAPYNSFGNGAAMRVSPAGFLAQNVVEAWRMATRVTEVTHNHPEGIRGGVATAVAIRLAIDGLAPRDIRSRIAMDFGYDLTRSVDDIRPGYAFDETCQGSVPEALTCALEATDYEDSIRNAISLGGDADTLGAIAGGLAEALFGIPEDIMKRGWEKLPDKMQEVLERLYAART